MDNQKILSIDDAAEFTGLKKSYLYRLTHQKRIPHYKPMGGRIFFKREELEAFIFRNRQSADYELSKMADAMLNGEVVFKKNKR